MPRRSALQPWVVFTGYSGSVEQTRLGRRPATRPSGSFRRGAFLIEVGEDLLDHHRIVDAGDDPHRPAAFPAGLDVDIEHPLETLHPVHRCPSLGGGLLLARLPNGMRTSHLKMSVWRSVVLRPMCHDLVTLR